MDTREKPRESRIPPDGLTGNNLSGRRLLTEMWRPTPRSQVEKAEANIAELRRILLFRMNACRRFFVHFGLSGEEAVICEPFSE